MSNDTEASVAKLKDMSLSYNIYLLSRKDFISGVLIGVTSSISISYVTQLDMIINKGGFTINSLIPRILISSAALGYLIYNHIKRTKGIETLLKKLAEKTQKINEEKETG